MFLLTKRSRANDLGETMHSIYGQTHSAETARAWYRASRATDVVDMPDITEYLECRHIGDKRLKSWREEQEEVEKLLRAGGRKT